MNAPPAGKNAGNGANGQASPRLHWITNQLTNQRRQHGSVAALDTAAALHGIAAKRANGNKATTYGNRGPLKVWDIADFDIMKREPIQDSTRTGKGLDSV